MQNFKNALIIRELAMASSTNRTTKDVIPFIAKDFGKILLGLIISVVFILSVK